MCAYVCVCERESDTVVTQTGRKGEREEWDQWSERAEEVSERERERETEKQKVKSFADLMNPENNV